MKKNLLFITIILSISNVYALNWEKLHSDSKSDIYLYEKKIKKNDKFIYAKLMVNFLEPINTSSSLLMQLKFKCDKKKIVVIKRNRFLNKYSDLLNIRHLNQWYPLSTSITKKLLDKVC